MSYTRTGPPFNFQGAMGEAQKNAFEAWVHDRVEDLPQITQFHRIRAHQLRKSAGLLEAFYGAQQDALAPTFQKTTWKPDPRGHFLPTARDTHRPAVIVGAIKDRFQSQLSAADRAVFRMNYLRTQIEAHEDLAQDAAEAEAFVSRQFTMLQACFGDPHYAQVLVREADTWAPPGSGLTPEPRYRTHPLDPPTLWERHMAGQSLS